MLKNALMLLLAAAPAGAASLPGFDLTSLRTAGLPPVRVELPAAPADAKAGAIQLMSSTRLKMDKEKGELTVGFPKDVFTDPEPGDEARLFVKITRGLPAPAISWATVLCSAGRYLGYKGSNLDFPERSGSFSVSETLALGAYPKKLIARTHPWLSADPENLDELCSGPFLEKMKDARAETLPARLGDFSFDFNPRKNTLKVKW